MKKLAIAAVAPFSLLCACAGQAQAVVCTGTTQVVGDGGVVAGPFLLIPGNCAEAGDKIFGEFSVSGAITGTGTSSFNFQMTPGNVTIAFLGSVGPNQTGEVDYKVAVDPALSQGFLLHDFEQDFTLNAAITGLPATAQLLGTTSTGLNIGCTRTVNPTASDCPTSDVFDLVDQMSVAQQIKTGDNAIVTAITDTISQAQAVPEPSSLGILGGALIGLWAVRRRRYG